MALGVEDFGLIIWCNIFLLLSKWMILYWVALNSTHVLSHGSVGQKSGSSALDLPELKSKCWMCWAVSQTPWGRICSPAIQIVGRIQFLVVMVLSGHPCWLLAGLLSYLLQATYSPCYLSFQLWTSKDELSLHVLNLSDFPFCCISSASSLRMFCFQEITWLNRAYHVWLLIFKTSRLNYLRRVSFVI